MSAPASYGPDRLSDVDRPAAGDGTWPLWRVLCLVVALYAAGASLAFLGFGAPSIVVLFLPAGITLSALLLNPRTRWPWILIAVAVAEVVVDVSHGMSPRWVWGFALANTVEPLIGALLLRRYVRGDVDLLRRDHLVAFLACCVGAGPAAGGLIGATMLALSAGQPWPTSVVSFWAGDATGVLVVGGCVLAWWHSRHGRPVGARWPLWVASAVLATVAGFWPQHVPLFYLCVPVLFALAFTQPLPVTMTAALATTVTANLMTSTGHGPWAAVGTSDQWRTLTLQVFLVTTILGALLLAVGVAERDLARRDTSLEREARLRLHALQVLTTDLAKAATSEAIAQAIVREGIGLAADQGSAAILAPDGAGLRVWTTGGRPAGVPGTLDADTPHTAAIRLGRPVLHQTREEIEAAFPELAQDFAALGIHSGLCVPIPGDDGTPLGALTFGFLREHGVDADVLSFADALASLSGQALRRAQTYEQEISAAHQLQQALLPAVAADGLPGVRVSADYRPADLASQVGGDWYDVFALPGGRIGFAVGDVVGHHVTAAAAMARLQAALRFVAQTARHPAQVLEDLDRASAVIPDSMMTTVGFADYDPVTRLLRFACAGHPPPLLVTGNDAQFLWGGRSLPLGVGATAREHAECVLAEQAVVVWYTDGLVERHGQHIAASMQRLADAAGRHGSGDAHALRPHLMRHMVGDRTLGDDTAILCVQFTAAADRG
ncbi:putative magnesium/manganese-dependent protein phosphatase with GAF domain [Actinoplanes missouriensis 431]|uniref:Putative magnesium/manganese-dependent protein phosphatase with GAF domain n=1 Tax=Actinoplanes missouriensis (strain ATCC 14538 / DSM 43046 / CBS 188.64 / JCM 3121 / NBRC 102363 / NCIMB 12654 / NRRL B-3342 / UNCC 431) TaxID=512565 RepID=I0H5V8_ACTM4|nr:SpoIIE family protein phosphatase [Actinoplanes missouriensis]BAL88395.1 putative magnesium/manganese-dependent protein phosphatase with GAF domain [Actinoplanes missouriensis 431]